MAVWTANKLSGHVEVGLHLGSTALSLRGFNQKMGK